MNTNDTDLNLSQKLFDALIVVHKEGNLGILAQSIAEYLKSSGLSLSRLQLPISALFGFKHPFYAGIILTWTEADGVKVLFRERHSVTLNGSTETLKASPYARLIFDGEPLVRYTPHAEHPIKLIRELHQAGFTDYFAFSIPLPDGAKQVMSLATHDPQGFPRDLHDKLLPLRSQLGVCIFAAYQSNAAKQIAITYLGEHTGRRVLEGEFFRGNSEQLSTLILFADVRNFTALSERVGAKKVTEYVNMAFEKLSLSLRFLGGEILKFIGDAALIIFPDRHLRSIPDDQISAQALDLKSILIHLASAIKEIRNIEVDGEKLIDMGIGLHIGEVFYGNIGAKDRLDFTVMGPAVNLASRLEGLTKPLSASILFSEKVYQLLNEAEREELELTTYPPQAVKGVSKPVSVWGLKV